MCKGGTLAGLEVTKWGDESIGCANKSMPPVRAKYGDCRVNVVRTRPKMVLKRLVKIRLLGPTLRR